MKSFIEVASYVVINLAIVHSACPSHSVSSAEACYWTVPKGTETNVINSCQADGGLLASITDLSVMDFLITNYNITLNKGLDRYRGFYIGVKDKSSEKHFVNYEGTNQTWTNWATGEPNDDDSPPQDCVIMKSSIAYKWTDTSCDTEAAGLCFIRFAETTVASETTTLPDHTTIDPATTTVVTTDLTTAGTTTTDKLTTETTSLAKLPTTTETLGTTQLHTTSTDVATQQSSTLNQGTNNQECLCVCYSTHPTINSAELQEKINKLIKELTIPKKKTSQNKRKLTSASDNRTSAKSIGYVGAFILILVGSFIIGIDALNLCKPQKSK